MKRQWRKIIPIAMASLGVGLLTVGGWAAAYRANTGQPVPSGPALLACLLVSLLCAVAFTAALRVAERRGAAPRREGG